MTFMEEYLNKFPYFMDKTLDSNNYKHHSITGTQLQEAQQILESLRWDKELVKPVQIYRVQKDDHEYSIHFQINVPIDITIFLKDDTIIFPPEYETGHYVHSDVSETIIPENKFKCVVLTPDGEIWSHGIPENDTIQHDEYDHDYSLDQIGGFLGVKRLTYQRVDPHDYPYTSPQYNNLSIESDYDYSNRLIEFCQNLHKKPLPLLYLKAWLGVDGTLINREKQLCKMAPGDMYGNLPEDDAPLPFEHRDLMCVGIGVEDSLFVYTVNTRRPLLNTALVFRFSFLDNLMNNIHVDGVIVPYIDGDNKNIGVLGDNTIWRVTASELGDEDYQVRFKYFDSASLAEEELEASEGQFIEEGLYTEEYSFSTVSCTNADVYVSVMGSDESGDGSSEHPYRTIKHGVSEAIMNDTVSVASGSYNEELIAVEDSINLITCGTATISTNGNTFMTISPNKEIQIDGIGFKKENTITKLENTVFRSNCNKEVRIVKTEIHEPIPPTPPETTAIVGIAVAGHAVVGIEEED